jgi:HSP20 family protein
MASRYIVPFGGQFGGRDPFRSMQRELSRMLDDTFRSMGENASVWGGNAAVPSIDVHESENELCVTADLPGVKESDIDLRVEGDLLTIRGEKSSRREQDERGYHVTERSTGAFQRTVRLPFAPDPAKVEADYADGVLTIHVSKQEQQERSRRIEVRRGQGAAGGQQGSQQPGQQTINQAGTGQGQGANDQGEPARQQAASEKRTGRQAGESGTTPGQQQGGQDKPDQHR